jgi:hypothetical protein
MPCLSKVIRRVNKLGRVVGLSLRCEGTCNGQPCRTHDRNDPENAGQILRFCACPEDIPIPQPDPISRANIVRGCRVAIRLRLVQGLLKPIDFCCVGACENTESTECAAVIHETILLADGGRQEVIVCRCIDKVDPVVASAREKPTAVASSKVAVKKRKRR